MSRCLRCGADSSWIEGGPPCKSRDEEITELRRRPNNMTRPVPNLEDYERLQADLREQMERADYAEDQWATMAGEVEELQAGFDEAEGEDGE